MHVSLTRTVLVTGAGSGIGAACARAFAASGAHVICTDRDPEAAAQTAHVIRGAGGAAVSKALDVTSEADWSTVLPAGGALDVLVHSAGISAGGTVSDTSFDEWRRVMSVNLDGAFLALKFGVDALRQRGGSIIAVASASGVRAVAGAAAYSTSKAALRMLVQITAKQCRSEGLDVRVNSISPAGVKTPLWSSMPFFQDLVRSLGSEEAAYAQLGASARQQSVLVDLGHRNCRRGA